MIKVNCLSPKYARGEHEFASFEEFARWYAQIKRRPLSVCGALSALAERGSIRTGTIDADSDFCIKEYSVRKELEGRTGAIKWSGGGYRYNNDPQAAIAYAKELDSLAQRREITS